MRRSRTWRVVAVVAIVVVLGVAIFAQGRSGTRRAEVSASSSAGSDVATVASDSTSSPSAQASPSTSQAAAGSSAEVAAFLRDELPRRLEGDPLAKGAVDAPVVLTEWADYRCPFCSLWVEDVAPELQGLIDAGTLRIEFRDLALFGDESVKAATAARAAGRQGKYFEFQDALFTALPNDRHPEVPDELVYQIVDELGLDQTQFATDWADPALTKAVAADTAEARSLGISATPAFVVGTQFLSGYTDADTLKQLVEEELAKR